MTDAGKVAAAAVTASLCAIVVKKKAPEIALVLTMAAGMVIMLSCMQMLGQVLNTLKEIAEFGGISSALLLPVAKITGIAGVTRVTAEICRDAKEGALAGFAETAGTILALAALLPLVQAVLSTLSELI